MKLLVVAICVLAGQVFCDDFEDASEHRRLEHPDHSKQVPFAPMLPIQPPSYQPDRQAAKSPELDLDKVLRKILDLLRFIHDKIYGWEHNQNHEMFQPIINKLEQHNHKPTQPVPFQPDRHQRGIETFLENLKDRIRDRDSHVKPAPFPRPIGGLEGLLQNIKDRSKPVFRPSGVDHSYAQRSIVDRFKSRTEKIREKFSQPDNSADCVDSTRSDAVILPHPNVKQQS